LVHYQEEKSEMFGVMYYNWANGLSCLVNSPKQRKIKVIPDRN